MNYLCSPTTEIRNTTHNVEIGVI